MGERNQNKDSELIAAAGVGIPLPAILRGAGRKASKRFLEFFAANIRNKNTREAYFRALIDFFAWCDDRGLGLPDIEPIVVAGYIEYLGTIYSVPTVKQHLAAIRMCFDWLVVGQIIPGNPASAVRGPSHIVKKGKTPVLSVEQTRELFDSIDTSKLIGLRDRAIIGVLVFSFSRVSAAAGMRVQDFYKNGNTYWIRLHEKGGKFHEVPAHHKAAEYLLEYLARADIERERRTPLFRTTSSASDRLTDNAMSRHDVLRMIKRRGRAIGLPENVCCHTFRATGITAYMLNGGSLEHAQAIAAHESPRTTKLYDRTKDELTLDEVERIDI